MMARPQQHLRDAIEGAPVPNGTAVILPLIVAGLAKLREQEQADRAEARGGAEKRNPHISDAGKCPRRNVLSLMNVAETEPLDTDSLLRFTLGHAFEEAVGKILTAYQGATFIREERVEIATGDTIITGRQDFGAVRLSLDEDTTLELKSSNARAVGFLVKSGSPNEDHISQLNLYLHGTKKKVGYLVYLVAGSTKGEPVLHAWRVDYDQARAERDIYALSEQALQAKASIVPPIPSGYTRTTYPCSYCSYKSRCHGS